MSAFARIVLALAAGACATFVHAALPGGVARAFHDAGIPLVKRVGRRARGRRSRSRCSPTTPTGR